MTTSLEDAVMPSLAGRFRIASTAILKGQTLKAKAFRGGAWLGTGSVAEQGSRFVRNMILVRLLAPSAFGTMAIVMSTGAILQAFTEIGIREAVIQNSRGGEPSYVNAAWWMAFLRALSAYLCVLMVAPWVAGFYGNPQLSSFLRVAVSGLLLEGAMSARSYVALKEMKFSRWAMIMHGGGILGVLITVVLSFFLRDVWALVIGTASESAVRCVLSYVICPFIPSLNFDKESFRELLQYSKGLFGLPLMSLIYMRMDVFVLGKLIPAAQLGVYSMGIALAQVPSGFLLNLLYQIFVPAFSQIREDKSRTNRVIVQVSSVIVLFGMPALCFVYFCGGPLLTVVYGQSYAASAAPLFVASAAVLIGMVNAQITGVFYALGTPGLHRRCIAVMAIVMVILIYPLSKWMGPLGAQVANLIAVSIGFAIQAERIHRITAFRIAEYWKMFARGCGLSVGVVMVWVISRLAVLPSRPLSSIGFGVLGCVLAYSVGCVMLLRQTRPLQTIVPE